MSFFIELVIRRYRLRPRESANGMVHAQRSMSSSCIAWKTPRSPAPTIWVGMACDALALRCNRHGNLSYAQYSRNGLGRSCTAHRPPASLPSLTTSKLRFKAAHQPTLAIHPSLLLKLSQLTWTTSTISLSLSDIILSYAKGHVIHLQAVCCYRNARWPSSLVSIIRSDTCPDVYECQISNANQPCKQCHLCTCSQQGLSPGHSLCWHICLL